jgi:hypothetical protein
MATVTISRTWTVSSVTLGDTNKYNYLMIPASDAVRAGGLNRQTRVTSIVDGFNFTYSTADQDYRQSYIESAAGATVTPVAAQASPTGVGGPFTYNTKDGIAITDTEKAITTQLDKGRSYQSFAMAVSVGDPTPAMDFPDTIGYLVFDFGFQDQVGPVKYLGRLSGSELLLDASFKFPNTILPGSMVTLLSQRSPWTPAANVHPGNFYATGSAAGRIAAQQTIDQITGAGLQVDVDVIYPGDRGLGGEGLPDRNAEKITDAVSVWGGDNLDEEIPKARSGA